MGDVIISISFDRITPAEVSIERYDSNYDKDCRKGKEMKRNYTSIVRA